MTPFQFIGMGKYNISCMKQSSYGVWRMVCMSLLFYGEVKCL